MSAPYTLSILHRTKNQDGSDQIKSVTVNHASVEEVGSLAHNLSIDNPWFVAIQDRAGRFQGAFLMGEYIESSTPQEAIIEMAEVWQSENPAVS